MFKVTFWGDSVQQLRTIISQLREQSGVLYHRLMWSVHSRTGADEHGEMPFEDGRTWKGLFSDLGHFFVHHFYEAQTLVLRTIGICSEVCSELYARFFRAKF